MHGGKDRYTIYAAAAYFGVFNKRRPRPTATIVDPVAVVAQKFRIVNCGPTQKRERRTPKHGAILNGLIAIDVGVETVHA